MTILPNICVVGKMGAGKSSIADHLVKAYGYEKLSFAAPLKAGCGTATDRELLQRVGVGVRELHPDFWVNLLLDQLQARGSAQRSRAMVGDGYPGYCRFVIDDCRFPNEADALRREGFVFVRVVASVNTRIDRLRCNHKLQDPEQLNHVSETALDTFDEDYRIVNDQHVDALEVRVQDVLNRERR